MKSRVVVIAGRHKNRIGWIYGSPFHQNLHVTKVLVHWSDGGAAFIRLDDLAPVFDLDLVR